MDKKDKLRFPVIREDPFPPSIRSLNAIFHWIKTVYPSVFNREIYEEQKIKNSVNVRFKLED